MRKDVLIKIEMAMISHNGNIRHCARRHCAQSTFRPAMVGIRPLLGSFHWSAFRRSAFGHAPGTGRLPTATVGMQGRPLLSAQARGSGLALEPVPASVSDLWHLRSLPFH